MDLELMEWLQKHGFAGKTRFSDINYANDIYEHFVDKLIRSPTTRSPLFYHNT